MDTQNISAAKLKELFDGAKTKDQFLLIAGDAIAYALGLEGELNTATATIAELGAATGEEGQAALIKQLQEALKESKNQLILLQSQNNQLQLTISELKDEVEESVTEIARLSRRLELQSEITDETGKLLVDVDGEPHLLHGNRFSFKGEVELNAKQLSQRPDLLSQMKERGSGALIPVNQ